MRKFLYSVFILAAVVLAACSNDDNGDTQPKRGLILNASVENLSSRATMTGEESGTWNFAFTENDQVSVSNDKISSYYTFTNNGSQFICAQAAATTEAANWYAYFPGNDVDLTNQTGTFADVANKFAVAGVTTAATTGENGLSITLKPKVAVLRIVKVDNYGPCDIYLKTANGKYVKGLKAKKNEAGFDVETSDTQVSVFKKESNGNAGIYYVIVPAGVKIEVWNDTKRIKTTKAAGLTAGKYYTITSGPTTGTAEATINGTKKTISWVQLWIGGPRIATENVADEMTWDDAVKTGSEYVWGANWRTPSKDDLDIVGDDGMSPKFVEIDLSTDNGVKYFKYKGTQPGYKSNEMIIPFTRGQNEAGVYWTSSTDGKTNTSGQLTGTSFTITDWYGNGIINYFSDHSERHVLYSVRPVLSQETVLWGEQDIKLP